jgi:AraC-like DNA-binding protein
VGVVLDTAAVEATERPAYWARATEQLFFPADITGVGGVAFSGRALGHVLGPVLVRRIAADPSRMRRTRSAIRQADPEHLELTMLVRGSQERVQDGRRALLEPGDIATTDSSRPFTVVSAEPFEMVTFSIPKSLLARDADRLCRATAVTLRSDAGIAAIIGPFLRSVADGLVDGRVAESDTSVGDSIVDLLRGLHRAPRIASPRALLLRRIQLGIEARLHDLDLSPASIAGEHFISLRHLHNLFADEGLTVSAWVRERRLEQCRRDLADPALADETVAAIALTWGFRNAGHFSRAYRAAYGRAPSAERPAVR